MKLKQLKKMISGLENIIEFVMNSNIKEFEMNDADTCVLGHFTGGDGNWCISNWSFDYLGINENDWEACLQSIDGGDQHEAIKSVMRIFAGTSTHKSFIKKDDWLVIALETLEILQMHKKILKKTKKVNDLVEKTFEESHREDW